MTCVRAHGSICTGARRSTVVSENSTVYELLFSLSRCLNNPPACLTFKEVCVYAGVDWLKLTCQSEGGETSVRHDHVVLGIVRLRITNTSHGGVLWMQKLMSLLLSKQTY